jgi:hypothetical protein
MVSWPPSGQEWRRLLELLPAGADRVAAQVAIEAAAWEFVELNSPRHDKESHRRRQETRRIRSAVKKVLEWIDGPHPGQPPRQEIEAAVKVIRQCCDVVDLGALLPETRNERLRSRLTRVWLQAGGGKPPKSETGPFARFLCEALALVPEAHRLDGPGIKAFAQRELGRLASLEMLSASFGGQAVLEVDEYLIGPDGRRRAD